MKRQLLLKSMFSLLLLFVGINAWGETATFGSDWNTLFGTSYSGTISSVSKNSLTLSGTSNNVSMSVTNGTSTSGYVKTSDFRMYNGYTMTLTAPTGYYITAISSTKGGKTFTSGISANVGTLSISSNTISWTGYSNSVVLTATGTVSFATITVTYKLLSSLAISGTPTKRTYEAGDAFDPAGLVVTGTYSDASTAAITEGIAWTLDPETLSAGATSCDVKATVGSVSSDVTTISGLTVNAAKTLIGIEVNGTPATFWKGDTFNHDGLTVTATYDDESKKDVTADATFSTPDMTTAGDQTITVTYKGETATYKINVQTIANTQETAYTVAQIKDIVDAGKDLSTSVYVKGTISSMYSTSLVSGGYLSYYISADGTTTGDQFEFFQNYKGANKEKWTALTDVQVGDDVIGYGTTTYYNNKTYEFTTGNYLVKHTPLPTVSIEDLAVAMGGTITPTITTTRLAEGTSYTMMYESSDNDVVNVSDDFATLSTGTKTGSATITAILSADGYKDATTTFTVTVTSNATLSSITVGGDLTKSTYTVGDSFSFEGLTATGNYSDNTTADLTSTVTWTVEPTTLTAATTSVTVKATSGEISGTKEYAVTVNKKASSITIANMEIGKNATDVAISATTTPSNATLTYEIIDGSDYVILTDGKISAKAAGTATVKATYAGTDEYASAETTFTVTVNNQTKITWDLSIDQTTSASTTELSWVNVACSMVAAKGSATTATNNYYPGTSGKSYTSTRFYAKSTLTFTPVSGLTINSITYTATTATYATALSNSTWTNATVTAKTDAEPYTVTITPTDGTKAVSATIGATTGATSVVVTYTGTPTANLAISSLGWGTFIAPFECEIPSGVTAYTVTVDGTTLNKEAVSTGKFAASTPYLVHSDDVVNTNLEGVVTNGETTIFTNGALVGNVSPIASDVAENTGETGTFNYLLQYNDNKLGFYKVTTDGLKIGTNRCYLTTTVSGAKAAYFLDDEVSGIADVNATVEANNSVKKCIENGRLVIKSANTTFNAAGARIK